MLAHPLTGLAKLDFSKLPKALDSSVCLEKLDKLKWCFGFCINLDGRLLGVRTDDPAVGQQLVILAQAHGEIVEAAEGCDALLSVKVAPASNRRGVRHFNILYSLHIVVKKSLDLETVFQTFSEALELVSLKLRDQMVHIDESRLFVWQDTERTISVVGPSLPCSLIVNGLRPHLEPERSSLTSFLDDGRVLFAPWDLEWRGRVIHHPRALTDIVLLTDAPIGLSRAQIILGLYKLTSGRIPHHQRIQFLTKALEKVQFHTLQVGELETLPQRFCEHLGLEAEIPSLQQVS